MIVSWIRVFVAWIVSTIIAVLAMIHIIIVRNHKPWEFWLRVWSRSLLAIIGIRVRVHNPENIKTPAIYIMNHQSMVDILTLPLAAPLTSTFVAKKEIRKIPFIGWVMEKCGCIFIDRKNRGEAINSIEKGVDNRPANYSILIYPEGTRSLNREMQPFKKGFYYIAKQTGLDVIPVGQAGIHGLALGKSGIKPGTLDLVVGNPISFTENKNLAMDDFIAKAQIAVKTCVDEAELLSIQGG